MKKIIVVSLFLAVLLSAVSGVKAADFNLACNSGSGCSPALPAFFPSSEIWYPGKTLTKTVQFTNNSSTSQKIGTQATKTITNGNLDQVIDLVITKSDSTVLYSNSLYSFYSAGETILLDSLPAGASETFSYTATMYTTSGNEYQDKRTQLDLVLGLISSPTPTPTPCTDSSPATPDPVTLNRVNDTEVKVIWGAATDPVTGYRVSWSKDTDTDGDGEGTRSVGKTTETNITGLNLTNYTYYFKVRAVNGCKEGDTTGIATIGDGTNYLTPTTTPLLTPTMVSSSPTLFLSSTGQSGQVAGAQTSFSSSSRAEVKGTSVKQGFYGWKFALTGALILASLLFFIIILWIKSKKK